MLITSIFGGNLLPFLKHKEAAASSGLIVKSRQPDEKPEEDQDDPAAAIKSCAQELIRAVHAKDVDGTANALKDAFDILESMPHEEGPHTYEAQNEKAGAEAE